MSRAAKLVIEPRNFGAVVVRRGRVVFRSTAADARAECREFIRNFKPEAFERIGAPAEAVAFERIGSASLAESIQW